MFALGEQAHTLRKKILGFKIEASAKISWSKFVTRQAGAIPRKKSPQ